MQTIKISHGYNSGYGQPNSVYQPAPFWHASLTMSKFVYSSSIYVLMSDGTIRTWGANANGNLGNGSTTDVFGAPVSVNGISTATDIQGHGVAASALLANGTMKVWGYNQNGVLGDGNLNGHPVTEPVSVVTSDMDSSPLGSSGPTITKISSNYMALMSDGTVRIWGLNHVGQMANGTTDFGTYSSPVALALSGITVIHYGDSCFAYDGTDLYGWGYNGTGQLGIGNNTTYITTPTVMTGLPAGTITQISTGINHTLILFSNGSVWAVGSNGNGQIGKLGLSYDQGTEIWTPVEVFPSGSGITKVAAVQQSSFALKSDGTLYGWGFRGDGMLGGEILDAFSGGFSRALTPIIIDTNVTYLPDTYGNGASFGYMKNETAQVNYPK